MNSTHDVYTVTLGIESYLNASFDGVNVSRLYVNQPTLDSLDKCFIQEVIN